MWQIAEIKHWSCIVQMCDELYREDPSVVPDTCRSVERTLNELEQNPVRGRALVCMQNGVPVGYALLISFWSNEYGGELCFIDELYVVPTVRGQGLASLLIRQLIKTSTTEESEAKDPIWSGKAPALVLEVTPKNVRARALYSKLGFLTAPNGHMIFSKYLSPTLSSV